MRLKGIKPRVWTNILRPLSQTWVKCNHSMDRWSHVRYSVSGITCPFSNFNGCTVEVREYVNNFIPVPGKYLGVTLNEHLEWSTTLKWLKCRKGPHHFFLPQARTTGSPTAPQGETQIAKVMGPTWGPPGSCRPQMGPMLAPWTLLLGEPTLLSYGLHLSTPQQSLTLTSLVTSSASTLTSDMLLASSRTTHEEHMTLNKTKSVWQPCWKTSDGTTSPLVAKNQDVPWCTRYQMIMLPLKRIWGPHSARVTCALLHRTSCSSPGPNLHPMDPPSSHAPSGTGTVFLRQRWLHPHMDGILPKGPYPPCLRASYQIRKIAGCACAGNTGNIFPRRRFQRKPLVSDPGMHHGTCVTHVPWCMSESLTCGDGENVPGIPGACAPAILRIWQEAHAWQIGPFLAGYPRHEEFKAALHQ